VRAGVFRGVRDIAVEDVPEPDAGPRDVVVEVAACGICGSDLHTFSEGAFVAPGQVMGHEFAGEVVAVGDEVAGIGVGDRVTVVPILACGRCPRCLEGMEHLCETGLAASIAYGLPGAFARYVRIPNAVLGRNVYRLPAELSLEDGAFVEPLAVAVHAVSLAAPRPTETAVVLGLGSIGQGVVQVLKAFGVGRVIAADVSPLRLQSAAQHGADDVIDGRTQDPLERVRELLGPGAYGAGSRADLVFECSGVPRLLAEAIAMSRNGGRVLVTALYDGDVPIGANAIVQKELSVRGTFAYRGDFATAIELLRTGRVQAEPLVSHRFPLDRVQEAFETQLDRDHALKVLVLPREA
jgi:2-desacetyl-2-hydroxyethyl bacteriochlorophyllide A dehydrogenase